MTESDVKASICGAIVETSFIVVSVRVGGGAIAMDKLNVLSLNNGTGTALLGRDWGSWAAVVVSWVCLLIASESEWAWIVPTLAWRQAHCCFAIFHDSQVTDVIFAARTRVKTQVAVGGSARSLLTAWDNFYRKRVSVNETDVVPD